MSPGSLSLRNGICAANLDCQLENSSTYLRQSFTSAPVRFTDFFHTTFTPKCDMCGHHRCRVKRRYTVKDESCFDENKGPDSGPDYFVPNRSIADPGNCLGSLRLEETRRAQALGMQPRVTSLRSSYTGLYPQTLHGVVSPDFTRGCIPRQAELRAPEHCTQTQPRWGCVPTQRATKEFLGCDHLNVRYLTRRTPPMSLRFCLPWALRIVHFRAIQKKSFFVKLLVWMAAMLGVYHESRRYSRVTYPESCITTSTSIRRNTCLSLAPAVP